MSVIGWAVWYDKKRRSRPDYKTNLVEIRKQELIKKREENDPTFYVKNLPLADNFDEQSMAMYTMDQMAKGEEFLEKNDFIKGTAHIAMGLSYMGSFQHQQALASITRILPPEAVFALRKNLEVSRGRAQVHLLSKFANTQAAGEPVILTKNTKSPKIEEIVDEPDIDSIDGDSEIRNDELEESKIKGKDSDNIQEIVNNDKSSDDDIELIEDSISEDQPIVDVNSDKIKEIEEILKTKKYSSSSNDSSRKSSRKSSESSTSSSSNAGSHLVNEKIEVMTTDLCDDKLLDDLDETENAKGDNPVIDLDISNKLEEEEVFQSPRGNELLKEELAGDAIEVIEETLD